MLPIFLVPGNHDPLTPESVWAPGHPFASRLPNWVHVVDRDDFEYELAPDAVLYAGRAVRRRGRTILAMALPAREPGDKRSASVAFTAERSTSRATRRTFPIRRDAGVQRGLDYLAIGDTHSFRDVTEALPVPTVYPGAPEATNFDEPRCRQRRTGRLFRHGMPSAGRCGARGVLAMARRAVP